MRSVQVIRCTAQGCEEGTVQVGDGGPCTRSQACDHCAGSGDEPCADCGTDRPAVALIDGLHRCDECVEVIAEANAEPSLGNVLFDITQPFTMESFARSVVMGPRS